MQQVATQFLMTPCYWGLVGEEKHQDHSPKHRLTRQQGNSCQNTVDGVLWRQDARLPEMPLCVGLPKWIVASDGWGPEGGEPRYWYVDRTLTYIMVPRKRRVEALSSGCSISSTAFDISGLGLRPCEESTWPMKGALWGLNLILSGLGFR